MKHTIISTLFFLLTTFAFGQLNSNLSKQLDSLVTIDQKWRGLIRQVNNKEIDTISGDIVVNKIRETDSLNFLQIKKLFDNYGYLGYDKVGKESSHNFWLLIQHADKYPSFQDSVLTKMKLEADKGNASLLDYAYLVDRVKVNTGQLQIYGTQMKLNSTKTSYETKPTLEPDKLNEKRKQVGLPPIEDYIKTMNERYYGDLNKN
ncbi:MAG: DUF6624 domain-containing protein [Bacteroidales bacterium]